MAAWRMLTASAAVAGALCFSPEALAQNHQLHVPIAIGGLPATLDRITGICQFFDAASVETHHGNFDAPISGGRVGRTATFDMRPTGHGADPARYQCFFRLFGRTASGQAV